MLDNAKRKRYDRLRDGDLLGMRMLKHTRPNSGIVWAAFSILEEDHCGIDIATEAHTQLLQAHGLLHPSVQLSADRPWRHASDLQGLVIDDFFCISVCGADPDEDDME